MSFRKLKVRPLMYSAAALFVGVRAAINESGKFREWHQLQQTKIETSATILTNQTLISSSGKLIGHELTYEFTAPNDSGDSSGSVSGSQSGGSQQSAAEVQALLEEQFWGDREAGTEPDKISETASEPQALAGSPASSLETTQAPTGESFFRGEQLVKPKDYRSIDTSQPISIAYAQRDPGNSAIVGTNAAPAIAPTLIGLVAIGGGLWFLWQGVKHCFRSPASSSMQSKQALPAESSTEPARRL